MQDNFKFGINESFTIKNENVGGILFDIDAKKTDGSVCDIADLNKVSVDIYVRPSSAHKMQTIFNGYLQDLLNALYCQDTRLEIYTKQLNSGYKTVINFSAMNINLTGEMELIVKVNFDPLAFTSLSKTNSSVTIETIPSSSDTYLQNLIVVETENITQDKQNIDLELGSDILQIVCATDNGATYDASKNAKISTLDLQSDGFKKSVSENLLIAENMEMLQHNPASSMKNLVLYRGATPLYNTKLKAKFSAGVAKDTKIIVTKIQGFNR